MDDDINVIIKNLSNNLQTLEVKLSQEGIKKVNIRFPRGVLRTASYFRTRLSFIEDATLKRNLSYHLQLSDVYRWLLNRFDIGLTAKEMIIKEGLCLFGNITGSIVTYLADRIEPRKSNRGVNGSITLLKKKKIISSELQRNLRWLWGIRCKEHINTLKDWEFQKYTLEQYNKSVAIWQRLEIELKEATIKGLI